MAEIGAEEKETRTASGPLDSGSWIFHSPNAILWRRARVILIDTYDKTMDGRSFLTRCTSMITQICKGFTGGGEMERLRGGLVGSFKHVEKIGRTSAVDSCKPSQSLSR